MLTTINRTLLSTALVKYMAEYVLRIVPENTHDQDKFVTPYEVIDMLRKSKIYYFIRILSLFMKHPSKFQVDLISNLKIL